MGTSLVMCHVKNNEGAKNVWLQKSVMNVVSASIIREELVKSAEIVRNGPDEIPVEIG